MSIFLGEHFRPNGKIFHSYNIPLHVNLRNFLTQALMGTWRKASLSFNPAHMVLCWNHFLTVLSSSIQKYMWQTYLLNFFRFRIGLHLSGLLLDLGTGKYELTYSPCTRPTLQTTPFSRSLVTSLSRTSEALVEMVGLGAATFCRGAHLIQVGHHLLYFWSKFVLI